MPKRPEFQHSRASRALAALLEAEDEKSKRLTAALATADPPIHRTELWRYSTGRVTPSAERASQMHHLTGGRIPADGWEPEKVQRRRTGTG